MRRAAMFFMAVLAVVGPGRGPACSAVCANAAAPADSSTMGRWETRAPALSDRSEVAGAAVGDRIYVVGGLTAIGVTADVQEYDPAGSRRVHRSDIAFPLLPGLYPGQPVVCEGLRE